jgi:hypothetical protein
MEMRVVLLPGFFGKGCELSSAERVNEFETGGVIV